MSLSISSELLPFIVHRAPEELERQGKTLSMLFRDLSEPEQRAFLLCFFDKAHSREAHGRGGNSLSPRLNVENSSISSLVTSEEGQLLWARQHFSLIGQALKDVSEEIICHHVQQLLSSPERVHLNERLKEVARGEGVQIADWDQDWGVYNYRTGFLKEHLGRCLMRALALYEEGKRRDALQVFKSIAGSKGLSDDEALSVAERVLSCSRSQTQQEELTLRTQLLAEFIHLKRSLIQKSPSLDSDFHRQWKTVEISILSLTKNQQRISDIRHFFSVLAELQDPYYDASSTAMLLNVLFNQSFLQIGQSHLSSFLNLQQIKRRAEEQVRSETLPLLPEGVSYKDVFVVTGTEARGVVGKYKPIALSAAVKEAVGYQIDSILGLGLTAPTRVVQLSMQKELETICALLKIKRREEALFCFGSLPDGIKNEIYGCLYGLVTTQLGNPTLGHDLFWNCGRCYVPDEDRIHAIQSYLRSSQFKQYAAAHRLESQDSQGSLQEWIRGAPQRIYDMVTQKRETGSLLRAVPKNLVHLYALLGLIKGQSDGSSGNAMVTLSEGGTRILKFHEFDDERSLPTQNTVEQFRLWQLGLPQAKQPFDRAFLRLFTKANLLDSFKRLATLNRSRQLSPGCYEALLLRLTKIKELFEQELEKPLPTLTPQELFFQIIGGKEMYERAKEEGLSDWQIFEFRLGEWGREDDFPGQHRATVSHNLRIIYS